MAILSRVAAALTVGGAFLLILLVPNDGQANVVFEPCVFDSTGPACNPIVIVPGIVASQNKKVLYEDKDGGIWRFAAFMNVYKGLIKKLDALGLAEGDMVFVAHYDWRKPAAEAAQNYLKPTIDEVKNTTGFDKVDIIAHSYGGLVARAYIQGDGYENDVDQLITLGTPHEGAADAYVAWEGGKYPVGWHWYVRNRIDQIEVSLKKTHNVKSLGRPASFRRFFPSLRDILPINDFARKDGNLIPIGDLAEQNTFLNNLRADANLLADRNIILTTIAGNSKPTLDKISLVNERTPEDQRLNRWRDGQANPDPPPLDNAAGDDRVLLSSAHLGNDNHTVDNAEHVKLPDKAKDEALRAVGLIHNQPGDFNFDLPSRILALTILSPLVAVIQGPSGEVLSPTENGFGTETADYDDDPADPDDPKVITFADPPPGTYTVTYTGTATGEYTRILSYADADETITSARDGTTHDGKVETETFTLGEASISVPDDSDYKALLKQIQKLANEARRSRLLTGAEHAGIMRETSHALRDLDLYEQRLARGRRDAAADRLRGYYANLDDLDRIISRLTGSEERRTIQAEVSSLLERLRAHSPSFT